MTLPIPLQVHMCFISWLAHETVNSKSGPAPRIRAAPRLEEITGNKRQEWQESPLIHWFFPRLVGCFLRCVSEWPFIRPPFWSGPALRLSPHIPRCPSSVFFFLLSDLSFAHLDLPPLSPRSVILRLTNQSVPTTASASETSPVA